MCLRVELYWRSPQFRDQVAERLQTSTTRGVSDGKSATAGAGPPVSLPLADSPTKTDPKQWPCVPHVCRTFRLWRKYGLQTGRLVRGGTGAQMVRIHVGRDLERDASRAKKGNQPFEFLVLHCALPQIHELAYDLEVAGFVVPG
jgi:hypothetical protein